MHLHKQPDLVRSITDTDTRQWSFLAFFFVFEVGSLLCGAAQSSSMFIVGRAIAGVGSSGIGNGALTIIAAVLPPRAQAKFLGVNVGLGQLGLALGPIVGGCFTQYVSWRWCTLQIFSLPFAYASDPEADRISYLLLRFLHQSSLGCRRRRAAHPPPNS